jgi:hypothetical protein
LLVVQLVNGHFARDENVAGIGAGAQEAAESCGAGVPGSRVLALALWQLAQTMASGGRGSSWPRILPLRGDLPR